MQTVELFSGTASFSSVALSKWHSAATYDICPEAKKFPPPTVHVNKSLLDTDIKFPKVKDGMLWASPPCEGFSIAGISHNFDKETRKPKSENGRMGMALLNRTIEIIAQTRPRYWFIENPRGMMRKVIDPIFEAHGIKNVIRHTVTYCQYGDTRMKPTDIWTNCDLWTPRPMCKNGMPCHEAAPRGSKTGTQGIKSYRDKSRIPRELFEEIFQHVT
tara:strand:- start:279 stop:926 length:648 start_codon:yes stop_codon:yes gene_type:complete